MIIIAESGATKTDWRSISDDGKSFSMKTPGMNVATAESSFIENVLKEAVTGLNPSGETVREIHFYAAGLISDGKQVPDSAVRLDAVFRKSFPEAAIEYASDLLDAARAVCGRKPGIAVILGTGSNSCEYDGEKIVKNVRSGGFILGDEGGGASLGKRFMSDFLKGLVLSPLACFDANTNVSTHWKHTIRRTVPLMVWRVFIFVSFYAPVVICTRSDCKWLISSYPSACRTVSKISDLNAIPVPRQSMVPI